MPTARTQLDRAMTEAAWMRVLIKAARDAGWLCFHAWTAVHSEAGYPDLTLVRGGRVMWIETKREGLQLTGRQRAWCDALRGAGCEVYAPCWPSHADEVYAALGYRDDMDWDGGHL